MSVKERLGNVASEICKFVLPIRYDYLLGAGNAAAICTLSSDDLFKKISESERVMKNVAIMGRLLSENRGIDAMISFAQMHYKLNTIFVCGLEVKGHLAGQALVSLSSNGIDSAGRIIGALGPHPVLCSDKVAVENFRRQVRIVNVIGTTDFDTVSALVA
jgi:tetrahydromethanopterin S-methyltransferase subunit A